MTCSPALEVWLTARPSTLIEDIPPLFSSLRRTIPAFLGELIFKLIVRTLPSILLSRTSATGEGSLSSGAGAESTARGKPPRWSGIRPGVVACAGKNCEVQLSSDGSKLIHAALPLSALRL